MSPAPRSRRPKFTQSEINSQLQQLFLFSSLGSTSTSSSSSEFTPSSSSSSNVADLDQLAPILLNISRSHQQDSYLRALKTFVKDKEGEIEKLCFENYQDFVGSVSQLLRVRQGTVSLKHRVVELNRDVQESGKKVADQKKALLEARRVGQNIDETIDTLQACLRVLDLSTKIQNLIKDEKFFSALRQLDDLQQIHLKPVLSYPFASLMLTSLPETRQSIKTLVTKSLKTWMYEARESSRSVGKGALENMELRARRWNSRKRKEVAMGTMRLAKINGPVELGVSERYEYNALDNDQVSIDFKPLYTCIHIYTTLDLLEELQLSYQADRRAQAYLLLSTSTSSSATSPSLPPESTNPVAPSNGDFSLPALSTLLEEIVGFFLIESHVLKTTSNFRSEQDVEQLWEHMCDKIVELVDKSFLKGQQDPQVFLSTKFKVLTFVQTLEGYGYSVSALHSLLLTLFSRYSQLLERKFSGDFEQIVLDDDHQPMIVNDREEFEKVVSVSWLPSQGEWSRDELSKPGFPLALPFSQTYPLCCIDIRSFTEQYYQFSEGFAEHHRDIDDVLRKALDNLLIGQVSENVQRRLTTITNLSQLAQIVVNVLFFKTACQDLETLLVTLRATQRGGTIHLDSLNSFNQTLLQTQDRIISQISLKIDSFFEEAEYPWLAHEPPPPSQGEGQGEASGYLMDLMDFVSTVMMSVLIQLPEFAKEYVYKGALKYCSVVLTSFLTDKEPRMVSDQGLMYLFKDVKWLIQHVRSLNPGSSGGGGSDSLLEVFSELNQTLTLLTSHPNPTSYLDPQIRQTQFPKINQKTLQTVLIKLVTFYNSTGSRVEVRRKVGMEELLRGISR
ncbi:Rab GTPase-binding exocyst subunit SEC15 [Sporobolomyces salmoneus]|uniref:Rab GTPase-binding exocyst subunit SEC15 n=1 Tax=Sporobolomyces salmoneus TaxID=183962 RepID=UPI00316C0EBF